jgi:hypothetical protein
MRLPRIHAVTVRPVSALALLAALPLWAHHSYAMFDLQREITLEGTVRAFQWTNPHVWIDMTVIDKVSGKPVNWSIEGKGPVELVRDGWRRDSIKPGDKVNLLIHPLKKGTNGGSLMKVLVNGKPIVAEGKGQ